VPKDYVPKNNGKVPILHYCQFLSIPIDGDETEGGKEHVAGYSFGKYDYADGFSFAKEGRGLLQCPPNAHDIHLAAPSTHTCFFHVAIRHLLFFNDAIPYFTSFENNT
jgi:hypothetical protein